MNKDKINSLEFSSMIPLIVSNSILGSGFLYLYNYSNKSAIISMIIGFIISILPIVLIFKVFNMYPNLTLTEKLKTIFPKWIYYIINTLFIIISFSLSALIFFRLTVFFHSQFTGSFSKYIIAFILMLSTYYLTSKNIEVITRFSIISSFICLFAFLFDSASLISQVNLNNILPLLTTNYKNILTASLVFSTLFSGPSFLLLIIPKNSIVNKHKLKKYVIISYLLSSLSLLLINVITLGTLGIDLIKVYTYPVYVVLKKIRVIGFINSIENLTVLMWFFILIFTSSLSLFFSKSCLIKMLNINKNKTKTFINIIMNLLIAFLPLLLFSNKSFFDKPISAIIPVIIYLVTYLLLIIILISNKIKTKN
jgi:spore germination protein (amino acid permease)